MTTTSGRTSTRTDDTGDTKRDAKGKSDNKGADLLSLDAVLLALAEPQPGEQRVPHLPVQAVAAQQAEARTRGLRAGTSASARLSRAPN